MFNIASRIFKQVLRDKRTLALILVAPLLVMTLLYFLMQNANEMEDLKIGTYDLNESLEETLADADHVKLVSFDDKENIESKVRNEELSAFIYEDNGTLHVVNDNTDPTKTKQLEGLLKQAEIKSVFHSLEDNLTEVQDNLQKLKDTDAPITVPEFEKKNEREIENTYLYGDEDSNYFDMISPILIVFFVFFFTFLISGISLLKERTSGTLEKMLSTPIKKSRIIYGYLLGYGTFAVIQTIVVILFSVYILKMETVGNILWVFVTAILVALLALSLGLLLSTFASSEFQMIQFIPLIVIPQVFFTGIINVDTMHEVLQWIAKIMPLYYAGNAAQDIMLRGYEPDDLWVNWLVLFGMFVVLLIINLIGMRKYSRV